jgi:hypothetical protein
LTGDPGLTPGALTASTNNIAAATDKKPVVVSHHCRYRTADPAAPVDDIVFAALRAV